jgi:hypothetical protein
MLPIAPLFKMMGQALRQMMACIVSLQAVLGYSIAIGFGLKLAGFLLVCQIAVCEGLLLACRQLLIRVVFAGHGNRSFFMHMDLIAEDQT